jgi:hypothetical protein
MRSTCLVLTADEWLVLSEGLLQSLVPLIAEDFTVKASRNEDGRESITLPALPMYALLQLGVRHGIVPATELERQFAAKVKQAVLVSQL